MITIRKTVVSLMAHVGLSLTGHLLSMAGNWTISPGAQVSCLCCLKSAVPHKILDSRSFKSMNNFSCELYNLFQL